MWLSMFMARIFRADDGMQAELDIHIFVYRCGTVIISSARQVNGHAPVAIHSVMMVVDLPDLSHDFGFLGIIACLPVFPVVIVSIWTDVKPPKEPA